MTDFTAIILFVGIVYALAVYERCMSAARLLERCERNGHRVYTVRLWLAILIWPATLVGRWAVYDSAPQMPVARVRR